MRDSVIATIRAGPVRGCDRPANGTTGPDPRISGTAVIPCNPPAHDIRCDAAPGPSDTEVNTGADASPPPRRDRTANGPT
ncbi:hypothetical protein PSU4_14550 [Pseudonocardia sulfidoxydans NBRC 16205]|uniref:Uncharacterized protein n=1 Tax=Pseudonocardia sulfidoxydans NBRC 16205 TaxID=1223511 RepID=A0A511DCH1_9PSEU|nr:hypothetical protein PSU4_14550 [Pseudonocardia sulfidoxydans NBRC 16205]